MNDLIKAIPEISDLIVKVGVADVIRRVCAPSLDLIGERIKGRLERVFEKAAPMIEAGGFEPQIVPDRILVPLLEAAALQDDETLQTMWAGLLANAASPKQNTLDAAFVEILRWLSPQEAALLNWLYEVNAPLGEGRTRESELLHVYMSLPSVEKMGFPSSDGGVRLESIDAIRFKASIDGLIAENLIRVADVISPAPDAPAENRYTITHRGYAFVMACRPPQPVR